MRTSKQIIGWLVAALALVILAAGCASPTPAEPTPAPQPAEVVPEATEAPPPEAEPETDELLFEIEPAPPTPTPVPTPKVVRVTFTQEPDSLNPLYSDMWFAAIARDLYLATGLIAFNEYNEPIAWTAQDIPSTENGGISADGTVITYKLREGLRWSDGYPLTAEDYVFTWQMIMADGNAVISRAPFDSVVQKVEALDAGTLAITLKQPYPAWPSTLFSNANHTNAIPKHVLEPIFQAEGTIDHAGWNTATTVSLGPFRLVDRQVGSYLAFDPNPDFWFGPPQVDRVIIQVVPDAAAQVAAVQAGESDIAPAIAYSDAPDMPEPITATLRLVTSGYKDGLFFNLGAKGHPALQDVRVRWAIVKAIHRKRFAKRMLYALTSPPATLWDGTPYGRPDLQPVAYDPDGAKQLLDDAGWLVGADGIREKDGVKLQLRYVTNNHPIRKEMQNFAQQMLADVGIATRLINYDSAELMADYDKGQLASGHYDIAEWSVAPAFPDPDYAGWLCREIPSSSRPRGLNWQYLCDPELDALFAQQAATLDISTRIQLFHEIGLRIYTQAYWTGTWDDSELWAVSPRMRNVKLSGATPFWNSYEWDME